MADTSAFYTVTYAAKAYYDMERVADAIVWTYPLVLAVACWDWLTSLRDEYERIWKRPLSLITVLYLGARYWSLIALAFLTWMYVPSVHSFEYCQKYFRWSCGMTIPIEIFSGGILLLRSWAFTGRKLYYLIIFVILYVAFLAYMLVVTFIGLELIPFLQIGQTRGRCITAGYTGNHVAAGFWVAPLAFCIILTTVTIIESVKLQQRLPSSRRSPLFKVFMRDGLMYLVVITVTNGLNVGFFVQRQDVSIEGAAMAFQFLFSSLMSCRLVLHLRDAEIHTLNSAAASIATKSFWKTGHAPATSLGPGKGSHTDDNGVEEIALERGRKDTESHTETLKDEGSFGLPLHTTQVSNQPVQIHIQRDRVVEVSEKEDMPYLSNGRY